MQKNPFLSKGSCCIDRHLKGIVKHEIALDEAEQLSKNVVSWAVTNSVQNALLDGHMDVLPDGCFELDPFQQLILLKQPPLMLESRSGTGKTNVLFQHAVAYTRQSLSTFEHIHGTTQVKPTCFITVSPRLKKELSRRYYEIEKLEKMSLPLVKFFSLQEIIDGLISITKLNATRKRSHFVSYRQHTHERKSHVGIAMEHSEIENEICGVIVGSLEAALKRKSLTREEYLSNKRSNVMVETKEGMQKRHLIYDEWEQYQKWKKEKNSYDENDVILELIQCDIGQLFDSGEQ